MCTQTHTNIQTDENRDLSAFVKIFHLSSFQIVFPHFFFFFPSDKDYLLKFACQKDVPQLLEKTG